jgi:hypothetical protein
MTSDTLLGEGRGPHAAMMTLVFVKKRTCGLWQSRLLRLFTALGVAAVCRTLLSVWNEQKPPLVMPKDTSLQNDIKGSVLWRHFAVEIADLVSHVSDVQLVSLQLRHYITDEVFWYWHVNTGKACHWCCCYRLIHYCFQTYVFSSKVIIAKDSAINK